MARFDDYRVNEAGSSPNFDLILGAQSELGLNFYGNTPLSGQFGPVRTSAPGGQGETPLLFSDYSNGMGMAYSGVEKTYAYAKNMYMRGPRKAMPGGLLTEISLDDLGLTADELAGEIRCAMDDNGDVVIGAGRHILRLVSGGTDPVDEYDTGVDTQIDSCLRYNGIPLFSTDQYADNWQYLTAYDVSIGGWVTANSNGTVPGYSIRSGAGLYRSFARPVYLEKMRKVYQEFEGVGGNRIIGNDTPFTYTQTQSDVLDQIIGDTSVYGASLPCGDSSYGITGIYHTNRIFFITKADGVYGIEGAGIRCPNFVPDLERDVHPDNGIAGLFVFGRLFVSTPQGVLMVDVASRQVQDVPTYVNVSFYFANETPIFGLPTAYTTDNGWLVTSLYNGTDSHICYTRPRETTLATVPNPMIWHGSECTIEGQKITMLHKTSVSGAPQILVGSHDGTRMRLYTLSVPSEGDPYVDYLHGTSSHQFARSGQLFLPFQDADDANAKKVIRRFDAQVDGLSLPDEEAGRIQAGQIHFFANADSDSRVFFETVEPGSATSEWEEQGVVTDSPSATMIPTLNTTSGKQIGVLLDWALTNQSESETEPVYTPFSIRSIKIRTDVYVEQLEEKTYTVAIGFMQRSGSGGRVQGDTQTRFSILAELQNADVVYMINEWRERLLVKVEPGMSYQYIREDAAQPPTLVVSFKITVFGRQFLYDVGHTFDSVYAWGN